MTQTLPAFPPAPAWAETTVGGELETLGDGRHFTTPRLYERVLAQVATGGPQASTLRLVLERCDELGDPGPTQVWIDTTKALACRPSAAQLRVLAAALIYGAELMEQADPCDNGTCGHDVDGLVASVAGERAS